MGSLAMELDGISGKSPSKVLEKLGHMLLDSSRALAENRKKGEEEAKKKAGEKASHSRSQLPKRKRHHSTGPEKATDADVDCIDLEPSVDSDHDGQFSLPTDSYRLMRKP